MNDKNDYLSAASRVINFFLSMDDSTNRVSCGPNSIQAKQYTLSIFVRRQHATN